MVRLLHLLPWSSSTQDHKLPQPPQYTSSVLLEAQQGLPLPLASLRSPSGGVWPFPLASPKPSVGTSVFQPSSQSVCGLEGKCCRRQNQSTLESTVGQQSTSLGLCPELVFRKEKGSWFSFTEVLGTHPAKTVVERHSRILAPKSGAVEPLVQSIQARLSIRDTGAAD